MTPDGSGDGAPAPGGGMPPWREPPRRLRELALALGAAVLGTLVALRTMVGSGLAMVPGNVEDARLVAFLLEHSWRWLAGDPLHDRLWSLPIFFPEGRNALAFSDAMLSFGPFYWPWRAMGLPPDTSYQLWLAVIFVLSSLAVHWLFRHLGASAGGAVVGAWLATFAASRLHQISHSQLLPLFYVAAVFAGVAGWAREASPRRRRLLLAAAVAALVAQLYGGFYLGALAAMGLAALLAVGLAHPALRRLLLPRLRADAGFSLLLAAAALLALWPWARSYGEAHAMAGGRGWVEISPLVPVPASWFYVTPKALAYGDFGKLAPFRALAPRFEHAIGLGLATTALVLVAALVCRRRPSVQLAVGGMALLALATTRLAPGIDPWQVLVGLLPPLGALRAVVRVGLLLPLVAGLVVALWLDATRGRRWRPLALLAVTVALAEQVCVVEYQAKATQRRWVQEVARRVDPAADAFVVTRSSRSPQPSLVHLDAAWATTLTGVPTVNGYSGVTPPAWRPLSHARARSETDATALHEALAHWLEQTGAPDAEVQWIALPAGHRGDGSGLVDPRGPPRRRRGTRR